MDCNASDLLIPSIFFHQHDANFLAASVSIIHIKALALHLISFFGKPLTLISHTHFDELLVLSRGRNSYVIIVNLTEFDSIVINDTAIATSARNKMKFLMIQHCETKQEKYSFQLLEKSESYTPSCTRIFFELIH